LSQPNEAINVLLPSGVVLSGTIASRLQNGSVMVALSDASDYNLPTEVEAEAVVVYRLRQPVEIEHGHTQQQSNR
jgi:hypothetical protein